MKARQAWALISLAGALASVLVLAINVLGSPLASAVAVALLVGAGVAGAAGVRRRGAPRIAGVVVALVLALGAVATLVLTGSPGEGVMLLAFVAVTLAADRKALHVRADLPVAPRPAHPVVVWNAKSGGGKAVTHHLADEARARGIEPLELTPGVDLLAMVRQAVDEGADALAAAGGDGTQALVATVAAEKNLPFACIPAGTRNHFALDLGVDRDDVVGALDALVEGRERVVDLAEINGRVFVNNCSLGIYAAAVQRKGYRDAKIRTILDTVPDVIGPSAPQEGGWEWTGPDGTVHSSAAVILVSNNEYRLGNLIGSGTRPRLDEGRLGVAVLRSPEDRSSSEGPEGRWLRWTADEFEIRSSTTVPIGIDGEAMTLEPPLRFVSRPGALRVLIAPGHPGASPSALQPPTLGASIRLLWRVALGKQILPRLAP
jgi:hypothetical protein